MHNDLHCTDRQTKISPQAPFHKGDPNTPTSDKLGTKTASHFPLNVCHHALHKAIKHNKPEIPVTHKISFESTSRFHILSLNPNNRSSWRGANTHHHQASLQSVFDLQTEVIPFKLFQRISLDVTLIQIQ